ncbi:PQ-loop repeat-containing protein 3 isoform X2 [Hyposmocoma kahamanoa]|uniref:PQ-loop repeat-containing protein 3 isoform X2 n=1 Tax=Hyposmocoma kahamanoa TaxID=1477025 RepID=UPI000E6D6A45|nr:PQ-loop repeat-containing protein 3 isoform X2 [Hyposmocoma kahamanoa]
MDNTLTVHIANGVSTFTILSCLFLKVPQIMNIKAKHSTEGIYIEAMLMEIVGFTIMTLYNYTNHYGVLTYLEYPIILFQIFVMLYYTLLYKRMINLYIVPLAAMLYVAIVLSFIMEVLPSEILSYLVPLCTPLSGFAKVTYIYGIVKIANADNVSLATWVISIATNLCRLFTVYVDSSDIRLMFNFFVSAILSFGVLFTAMYYQQFAACDEECMLRRRRSSIKQRERKAQHED